MDRTGPTCVVAPEGSLAAVHCPYGAITTIDFASFGISRHDLLFDQNAFSTLFQ